MTKKPCAGTDAIRLSGVKLTKFTKDLHSITQAEMMSLAMRSAFYTFERTTSDGRVVTLRRMTGLKKAYELPPLIHIL